MADVRKFSDAEINRLVKFYEREILVQINKTLLAGKKDELEYLKQMRQNIDVILRQLREGNKEWCMQAIANVYSEGMKNADAMLKDAGVSVKAGFGAIHQQAVQVLAENTFQRFEDVVQVIGRQVEGIYRDLALESIRGTVVGYETWKQVANRYREQLAERGVTGFKDRSGKMWNMRAYTEMVARTTTMEAHLQGTANRLVEQGHDLVKVSTQRGACELCQPWQGKILSITGKTEGYPTLEEAKAAGLFHPNCRHAYGLYIDLDKEIEEETKTAELTWVNDVKARIEAVKSRCKRFDFDDIESEVSQIGKIIRENSVGDVKLIVKLEKECEKLRVQMGNLWDSGNMKKYEEVRAKWMVKNEQLIKAKSDTDTGKRYLESLKQVRDFGGKFKNITGDQSLKWALNDAAKYLPTEWIEKSNKYNKINLIRADRGFYIPYDKGRSTIALSSAKKGEARCALHELSHRMESCVMGIGHVEEQFYNRRTKGEALIPLGAGYGPDEKYKKDKFVNRYMGKYYGDGSYELLSMGMEGIFWGTNEVIKDTDYVDFVLGVLASI
jgi:hypothetical protein